MIMNAAHETGGTPVTTPTTAAARLFEAELAHQRIAPDNATSTVAFLIEDPEMRGEGFVTVEAARMLVAKVLRQVDETVNTPLLAVVAHEIAPDEAPAPCPHRCMRGKHCGGCGCPGCGYSSDHGPEYPRRTASGDLAWACCESTIGPLCNHRLTPGERLILAGKQEAEGRWARIGREGDRLDSLLPSQMDLYLTRTRATMFGTVSVTDTEVIMEVTSSSSSAVEPGARTTLVYRWEPGAFQPPPGYEVYGPGPDYDDNGNWRAAPRL